MKSKTPGDMEFDRAAPLMYMVGVARFVSD
jgi:hypothetical protein